MTHKSERGFTIHILRPCSETHYQLSDWGAHCERYGLTATNAKRPVPPALLTVMRQHPGLGTVTIEGKKLPPPVGVAEKLW